MRFDKKKNILDIPPRI